MSASYPTAIKSFTSRSAGDTIQPAHVNDLQDEVTAIETAHLSFQTSKGSWTPVLGGDGGTGLGQAYSVQLGRYFKDGTSVWCVGRVTLTNKDTITGNVVISGLPFTAENTTGLNGTLNFGFWNAMATSFVYLSGVVLPNTTYALLFGAAAAGTGESVLATANIGNTTDLQFSINYISAT